MTKNIEVERRGPLSKEKFIELLEFFERKGEHVDAGERLSLMYFRDKIPKKSDEIKNDPIDLRLRITEKKPELVLKYGLWDGTDARKEFNFNINLEEFTKWIDFLKCLNWKICVVYSTRKESYKYKDIEFTLVDIKDFGYAYEAEILSEDDEEKIKQAKAQINQVCDELKLKEYGAGEFEAQCDSINNKKEFQFDFSKDNPKVIKEKFKEYFEE